MAGRSGEDPRAAGVRCDSGGGAFAREVPAGDDRADAAARPGPKRARLLHEELGIESLQALRAAALGQRLRTVKRLGPKFEASVLATLEALPTGADADAAGVPQRARRLLLPAALELGETLAAGLRAHYRPDAEVLIAGSARRGAESVKDLDLVAVTTDPQALARTLGELEQIEAVSSSGKSGARGRTHSGVAIDLRIAAPMNSGICCSTSRVPRRTTQRCAHTRCAAAGTSPSTGSSRTPANARARARARSRCTSSWVSLTSSRSCARIAASWRRWASSPQAEPIGRMGRSVGSLRACRT